MCSPCRSLRSFHWLFVVLLLHPCRVSVSENEQCPRSHVELRDFLYGGGPGACPATLSSSPPQAATARRLTDFVFLIEYSQAINKTYLDYFTTSITRLSSMLEASKLADPTFTILVYSLEQDPPAVLYHRHFHSSPGGYDLRKEINKIVDHTSQRTLNLSSREMEYMAVDRVLEMLSSVLKSEAIAGFAGQFSIRPHTSLHVVVGLGLFEKTNDRDAPTYSSTAIRTSIEKNMDLILEHLQHDTTLHFFLSRGVAPAVEFIGSPHHEVRYRDCTHLNRALTLQALLGASGQAGSLQAHLLARGRDIHVMDLSALKRTDCIRAISPVLWSGSQLSHIDECSGGRDGECVSSDGYCSPLHGCVVEPLDSSSADSHDDKVPLTGHLVMSHADLTKPATGSSDPHTVGATEELSITGPPDPTAPVISLNDVVTGKPQMLRLSPDVEFAERLIEKGEPVVVKNSVVSSWAAMEKWNFSYLADNMGTDTLARVKCTNHYLTFDPDRTAPLKLSIALPFTERNMSTSSFFSCIQEPSTCFDGFLGHYYFGRVPDPLQADLSSARMLYRSERDYKAGRQFVWVSSAGMVTHGHFDQDYNLFVQLRGEKRFTLWSPSQHQLLYMYPRVHPLWHKSRVNLRTPDLTRFPDFAKSRALQVVLEPGDVLYVPPYTWHYVETFSPSVSLSTWSHDYDLYDHMNAIYRHDHKFDLIKDPRGQMFALRLYLDMMIHDLYGFNQTTSFIVRLLSTRFRGLHHLFPPSVTNPSICSTAVQSKIPTCVHVHGYVKLDMAVIGTHFKALWPEVMDVLFADYVEEITAQVVGVRRMLAFFRYCFLGQEYYVTEMGDQEHALWDHKDPPEDSDSVF